jgi:pilus assembly protein FimV
MRLDSSLNQPLSATIQLQDGQGLSASDVIVSLAEPDAFEKAGIDRPFFLTDLRFVPVVENNRLFIRVESTRPVREPYLNFLVELRRPGGRILREYTVLLDPPLYEPQRGSLAAPATTQTPPRASQPVAVQSVPLQSAQTSRAAPSPSRTQLQSLPDMQPQEGATQYTTQSGDSLWDIAVNQRPDRSVPIRVSMSAIHALNPDAFIDGDIDRLRRGHTLTLPTRAQLVSAGAPPELVAATSETQEAMADVPASPALGEEPTAVPVEPSQVIESGADIVSEPMPDADETANDVTSLGQSDVIEDPDSIEVRLRIDETTLEAVDADSAALLGRLNALEGRFNVLLSELDARDAQIASLQAELEVLRQAKTAESELNDDLAGTAGAGSIGSGDMGAGPSSAAGSDDPADGSIAANVLPGEASEPTSSSFSWLSWLTIPLVFIAFLLGLLISRRRNQDDDQGDQQPEPELERESHVGGFSSNITTVPAMVARPVAQQAPKAPVDPLDGVELYITYGRFAEARTMLDKAIDEEPERLDLRYKQLRVLAELGEGSDFAEQAEEVRELGGDMERVDQIKARFPLMFNDNGDMVAQSQRSEPLLGEDVDEDSAEFRSGVEDDHDESNTSQLNLNDFTLDPDWDLIDGLSPEPMRKTGGKDSAADVEKTITEAEFESGLHEFPHVEELDEDHDEHFSSSDSDAQKKR